MAQSEEQSRGTGGPLGGVRRAWSLRWPVLRLLIVGAVLLALLGDNPSRMVRLQLAGLPDYDYSGEVRRLREEGRFGEAMVVADAGLEELEGVRRAELLRERQTTVEYRDSKWRKLREVGRGALIGQGSSIEELVGAVGADMLVVGDVRDLVIQGARYAVDRETDELIVALSAVGLVTTVAPEVDWAASLMKIAKKAGAMSKGLADSVLSMARRAARAGDHSELAKFSDDVFALSRSASPAGAIRIMKLADEPKDVQRMAEFVRRERTGAFVLHATGKEGASVLKVSGKAADEALKVAAKKGDRGLALLRSGNIKLLRPHPLLGLGKSMYKGTAPALFDRMVKNVLDPGGMWAILGVALWGVLEMGVIYRRITR